MLFVASAVLAQSPGSLKNEQHPALSVQTCTKAAGCTTEQASVVIDSNWRWLHKTGQAQNCYSGNQ